MEAVGAYSRLLAKRSEKRSDEVVLRRRREVFRRRRKFITKQRRQRVAFLFVISIAVLHLHSPIRSVWCKERSSYWWEQIVGQTFTTQDWLENFRMTNATFTYLCNEI